MTQHGSQIEHKCSELVHSNDMQIVRTAAASESRSEGPQNETLRACFPFVKPWREVHCSVDVTVFDSLGVR